MTAMYLLLILCAGDACRLERVPVESMWACVFGGQPLAGLHMGRRDLLAKWRCEAGERA